jgi:hypothetical protein
MALVSSSWEISLPAELHAFVTLVLDAPHLQQRLAPIAEANAFAAEAIKVADEHAIALDAEILKGVLRPDPLGLGRVSAAPILCTAWPPAGWLPSRSIPMAEAPAFDWLWLGSRALLLPFFEDDICGARAMPFNWLFRIRTSMETVIAGAGGKGELPLQGLIFHMSRCGSTLLAQMLAAVPGNAVSSEPEPLDGVIQWARKKEVAQEIASTAIRAIVAALSRDRRTGALRHFIKLDAGHALALPLIRTAFPYVNWVYLYRSGVEVMVSHMRQPGALTTQGVSSEQLTDLDTDVALPNEEFAARVIARIGKAIIAHFHLGGGMLVAYPDIAGIAIAEHFGLELDSADKAALRAAASRDAKYPEKEFASDILLKQRAATEAISIAAERWLQPVEQELRRLSRSLENMVESKPNSQLCD